MAKYVITGCDADGASTRLELEAASAEEAAAEAEAQGLTVESVQRATRGQPATRRGSAARPRSPRGEAPSQVVGSALVVIAMVAVVGYGIVGAKLLGVAVPPRFLMLGGLLAVGAPLGLLGVAVFGAGALLSRATGGLVTPLRTGVGCAVLLAAAAALFNVINDGDNTYTPPALLSTLGCLASVVAAALASDGTARRTPEDSASG